MIDKDGNKIVPIEETAKFVDQELIEPFIYKSDYGNKYLVKQRRHFDTTILDGYCVCEQCEKNPARDDLTLGESSECGGEEKHFCSKECLMKYLESLK